MQNQIFSYSFPLFESAQNVLLSSFKNKYFIIAANTKQQSSAINLFKYDDSNPKKSNGNSIDIEGKIAGLLVAEDQQKSTTILSMNSGDKWKINLVNIKDFSNNKLNLIDLIEQDNEIDNICLKKDQKSLYYSQGNLLKILDIQTKTSSKWIQSQKQLKITSLITDPIHQLLTYCLNEKQIIITDKKSNNQKYSIKGQGVYGALSLGYNPNKQFCLMSCHHQSVKFWDIRRGALPVKTFDDHHTLLTHAKYNHSHDQLVACSYDDGSVALMRFGTVSSSPQNDAEDTLIKMYDQHQDAVGGVEWSAFTPWIFASVTYNAASLVVSAVPTIQKFRILH